MNLNINWSVYLSYDIHTSVVSIEYSDFFFQKTNLEYKKLKLGYKEMIEHIVPSDRDIVKKLLIDHSVTYEPLKFKTQLNEFLPIMEFQAYFLYLENSIEILCLEESIDAQMIQKAMIGEDLLLTINNYIDLEKRLHNAKKCELITDFLYSIRDFVQ